MEGNGNKVVLTILSIILILGLGVGGYYLGWYLDKQAAAKQAEEMKGTTRQFINNTLGIKFSYPGTWTAPATNVVDGITTITLESTSGSVFSYVLNSSKTGVKITYVCDEDEPNGGADTLKKCTFVSGNPSFARYNQSPSTDDGSVWVIAEPADDNNEGSYLYNSLDAFIYKVKADSDLVELDKIMKSVIRSK